MTSYCYCCGYFLFIYLLFIYLRVFTLLISRKVAGQVIWVTSYWFSCAQIGKLLVFLLNPNYDLDLACFALHLVYHPRAKKVLDAVLTSSGGPKVTDLQGFSTSVIYTKYCEIKHNTFTFLIQKFKSRLQEFRKRILKRKFIEMHILLMLLSFRVFIFIFISLFSNFRLIGQGNSDFEIQEIFACEIWNLGFGIRNTAQGIRNPANDWSPWIQVPLTRNLESSIPAIRIMIAYGLSILLALKDELWIGN